MAGKILDSNIVIDLFRENAETIEKIKGISLIHIPVIVLGELFYGANLSRQVEKRIAQIRKFSSKVVLLDCDKTTAEYYGQIKSQLNRDGKPIPENDVWIAAIAKQHNLTLVTNDAHFSYVEDLSIEKFK